MKTTLFILSTLEKEIVRMHHPDTDVRVMGASFELLVGHRSEFLDQLRRDIPYIANHQSRLTREGSVQLFEILFFDALHGLAKKSILHNTYGYVFLEAFSAQ